VTLASAGPSDSGGAADPDLALLRQARTGDFTAFEMLVNRFQPRVYGLARRILANRHDAEDVTQQTFLSLIENLTQFREESSVAAWIFRIATNHALKLLRKRQGTTLVGTLSDEEESYRDVPHPEFIAPWRDDPSRLAQQAEIQELLERAIGELDEKHRLVFILRDIERLSVRETAEILGLTETNTKVRLLRARMKLRERLTRILGNPEDRLYPQHEH
jgi:RNA polymerase sigma-70 factor (ECF subfamily)